ncbi:hypothetical protein AB4400_08630 [Vibrio sp. 10N.261.48.A2]
MPMNKLSIQKFALKLLQKFHIVEPDLISSSHFDYQIPLEKHLDEYRELLFEIEHQTQFFTKVAPHWSKNHALLHDDFLENLLKKRTKTSPVQQYRTRPKPPFIYTKVSAAFNSKSQTNHTSIMTHKNNSDVALNIPTLHPDSLLDLRVNAKLLTPPCAEITFQFNQIDWQSYNCEPNGILINDHYPANHQSQFGNSALVEYRSMEITNISRKENYEK